MQTKDSVSAQKSRKIAGLNDRESWAIKRCFHMGDETEMKLASLAMHIGAKYFLKSHSHFLKLPILIPVNKLDNLPGFV